jgi:hypothetical protein
LTPSPARIYPEKVKGKLAPGRIWDGGRREVGLSYDELSRFVDSIKAEKPVSMGQTRVIAHEVYGFSNGKNSVDDIARKVGYEYDLEIDPRSLMPFVRALSDIGMLQLKTRR